MFPKYESQLAQIQVNATEVQFNPSYKI